MEHRWSDYALPPTNGADFARYVGTVLEDLGYGVSEVAAAGGAGVDLIAVEPATNRCIAVRAPLFSGGILGNDPIQQLMAAMPRWGAAEGWVITDAAGFNEGAWRAAQVGGIRLVSSKELGDLVSQASSLRALGYGSAAAAPQGAASAPASPAAYGAQGVGTQGAQVAAPAYQTQVLAPVEAPYGAQGTALAAAGSTYAPQGGAYAPDLTGALTPVSAAPASQGPPSYTFMDVMMRWNCTDDYLREQMRRGMPLYQQADGSYAIAEQELFSWEYMMAMEASQQDSGGGCAIGAVASLAIFVVLIVALVVFWPHITEAIESTFPGVHVLTWEELWEKLPWSQQG